MHHRRNGFTLIELLTTIAIIAVLAALFLPVLQSARKAVQKTVSGQNLKSLSQATSVYATDYDEVYPPVFSHGAPVNGGAQEILGTDTLIFSYLQTPKVWASPIDTAQRLEPDVTYFNDGELAKKAIKRSYQFVGNVITRAAGGYDFTTGMGVGFPNGYWDMLGRPVSAFEQPSDTALIVEAWRGDTEYSYVGNIYYNAVWACLTWLLPGRPAGAEAIVSSLVPDYCVQEYELTRSNPGYFNGQGLYSFADGRIASVPWAKAVRDDFELLRAVNRAQ